MIDAQPAHRQDPVVQGAAEPRRVLAAAASTTGCYFGTEDGTIVLRPTPAAGAQICTYRASGGRSRAAPSYDAGKLYFGSYGGDVQAVRPSDGQAALDKSGVGARAGRVGNFYATAAVAFGRVYIGFDRRARVTRSSSRSGKLAWARQTGGYVYSSAAVEQRGRTSGRPCSSAPTTGHFYAFDARSGRTRWTYDAGGRISGSPTVIGNTVYFANLAKRETVGLSTARGRVVFRRTTGTFDPIVSDGQWLYLTGSSSVTALRQIEPRTPAQGAGGPGAGGRRAGAAARRRARTARGAAFGGRAARRVLEARPRAARTGAGAQAGSAAARRGAPGGRPQARGEAPGGGEEARRPAPGRRAQARPRFLLCLSR